MEKWPPLPYTGGGDLWSYTSCNTGTGTRRNGWWTIPPINERIQAGFLNFTQGATGLLYSGLMDDRGNAIAVGTIWIRTLVAPVSQAGRRDFSLSTTNWFNDLPRDTVESIRDGIQDYEYAQCSKIRAKPLTSSCSQRMPRAGPSGATNPGP